MREMYIVVEYLLLENFLVNYLILYLNTYLVRIKRRNIRVIMGAFIGSFYSLIYFFPSLGFLTGLIPKTIFSMVIVLIAFGFTNIKVFLKSLLGFYLVTFIYGGATLALFYSSKGVLDHLNTPIHILGGFPVKYLILGVLASLIIGKSIFVYFNEKITRDNYIIDVTIEIKGEKVRLKALLDTGHSLKDPFTGRSVFVVEYSRLKHYLPSGIEKLIEASQENNFIEVEYLLNELKKDIILTIVPFGSLGKNGILFAFKVDNIVFHDIRGEFQKDNMLVGLYAGSLSKEMGYSGLLNYEYINGGVANEQTNI